MAFRVTLSREHIFENTYPGWGKGTNLRKKATDSIIFR